MSKEVQNQTVLVITVGLSVFFVFALLIGFKWMALLQKYNITYFQTPISI